MRQFITFAGVGAIGTTGHYLTLLLLVEIIKITPVIATTAGFIVGAIINYILNYVYTFKSSKNHLSTSSKFFLIALISAGVNSYIMYLGTMVAGMHYFLTQIIATSVVLILNYTANRLWTFAEAKTK